jgi:hypothetical protein
MNTAKTVILVAAFIWAACEPQSDEHPAVSSDSATAAAHIDSNVTQPNDDSIAVKMGYPFTVEWIPGQKDTEDFDVLSKFRAHERRASPKVLILTLDTPSVGSRTTGKPSYLVADSVVITGLSYGDMFSTDCRLGGVTMNGLVGGLIYPKQESRHPRFAWRFDTLSVKIRSVPPDSVSCYYEEVD